MIPFRVIDTGVRDGRRQIAFDQALIDLHKAGTIPDTVRFLRFRPSALIGRHQALGREIKRQYCAEHGIGLVRRITGGGAIYLDEGQVGWELTLSRARLPMPTLGDYTRAICEAVARGLSDGFGLDIRFRPRNDIECGGRKLCGTGGFFDGDTLFYQGTVLVDADPARVMGCLNVPAAKLAKRDLDKPESRVTTLKALLGAAPSIETVHAAVLAGLAAGLGIEPAPGRITDEEERLAEKIYADEIGRDDFVAEIDEPGGAGTLEASRTGPGGTVSAFVRLEGGAGSRRIRDVLLTGDFFITPPRIVYDLEARLRGVGIADIGTTVDKFMQAASPDLLSLAPGEFRQVIEAAVAGDNGR